MTEIGWYLLICTYAANGVASCTPPIPTRNKAECAWISGQYIDIAKQGNFGMTARCVFIGRDGPAK